MGKSDKKRRSTADDERKSENKKSRKELIGDDDGGKKSIQKNGALKDQDVSSTNETLSNQPRPLTAEEKRNINRHRSTKDPQISKYRTSLKKVEGVSHKGQVEKIIRHKQSKEKRLYLVKWKDELLGETWESSQKVTQVCLDLYRSYIADVEKRNEIEAVLSHRKEKNWDVKYLIKWKDASRGETWERGKNLLKICPKVIKNYEKELEKANRNQIETVIQHNFEKSGYSKFLVQWKDHSKGKTWETAKKVLLTGPDALDKFLEKNPKCVPRFYEKNGRYSYRPDAPETTRKIQKDVFKDDTSDEDEECEVLKIMDDRNNEDESREFLIRWKGYSSNDDSWEAESNLNCPDLIKEYMAKMEIAQKAGRKSVRARKETSD